jgi:hypothetical protein
MKIENHPLSREQWFAMPFELRQRWWRETDKPGEVARRL